jgi:AcrR family transcriptional regulator
MESRVSRSTNRSYSQTARALSAEATAQRILDSFLERLMTQWFDEITLDAVARDAEVTVQTVVRRFGGKDGLLAAAVKILGARINAQRGNPAGDIHRVVASLIDDYEQTGDAIIRLLAVEPRHPPLKEFVDFGRGEHRRWLSDAFAGALSKLDTRARQRAVDQLVIVTDVYTWKLLRRDMNRSAAAATEVIRALLSQVIHEISIPKNRGPS